MKNIKNTLINLWPAILVIFAITVSHCRSHAAGKQQATLISCNPSKCTVIAKFDDIKNCDAARDALILLMSRDSST